MAYLTPYDYLRQIQQANLSQLITSNDEIRLGAELSGQSEAMSYLRQKYDVQSEFTDTNKWDYFATYSANNRVYLDADGYIASKAYAVDDLTLWNGNVYKANAIATGVFDATKWDLIGKQGAIYYAQTPNPTFDVYSLYKAGDEVFYKNKVYECLKDSIIDQSIQNRLIQNFPLPNVFPDATNAGAYWSVVSTYTVPTETDITDTDFWTKGDNRDQQMVMYFIDITLFHLHSRISPNNVPQLRVERYHSAIEWLKMCANGDVTPTLVKIQPNQGNRIRFGGAVKNINSY